MDTAATSSDLPDYAGFIRRQWRVIGIGAIAGFILGLIALQILPPKYTASASVLVQSVGNQTDVNVTNGRTQGDVNLDTEAQLVKSTPVAARAAALLATDTPPTALAKKVFVSVPANTNVLRIQFTGRSPATAAAGAHAFAQAYLANREASAQADLDQQIREIQKHIRSLEGNLRAVSNRLQDESQGSSAWQFDRSLQQGLSNQINTLNSHVNDLETTTVIPGQIIADAELPRGKSGPNGPAWLAGGVVVGILGGILFGLLRYRYDRRLRTVRDIEELDASVLVRLPVGLAPDIRRSADAEAARGVRQLCNVMASTMSGDQRIIAVTGVDTDASSIVTNLAVGLSGSGWEIAVVCAGRQARQTAALLQVSDDRGLSEALRETADVSELLRPSPMNSRVMVLPPGVDPDVVVDESGPAAVGRVFGALRADVDAIIVQTPPTDESGGATAQMIASVSDSALFVVELDRSRDEDLTDAVRQFVRVGANILGVVAMDPPHRPARARRAPFWVRQEPRNVPAWASEADDDEPAPPTRIGATVSIADALGSATAEGAEPEPDTEVDEQPITVASADGDGDDTSARRYLDTGWA